MKSNSLFVKTYASQKIPMQQNAAVGFWKISCIV